jgi:hypothetical protein
MHATGQREIPAHASMLRASFFGSCPFNFSYFRRTIMRRFILTTCTCLFVGLAIAPAFADEPDFKTTDGIKKFWDKLAAERGGGDGGN